MKLSNCVQIAETLFTQHNLSGWRFEFDNAKSRFGKTSYSKKLITLSKNLVQLNNDKQVIDTLLHEVAHALCPKGSGHNRLWKLTAQSIGCNPSRTYSAKEVLTPPKKFVGTCPSCSKTIYRHKRNRIACANCCNKFNNGIFDEKYLFTFSISK